MPSRSAAFAFLLAALLLAGCRAQRRKSDAELGLNEQQARGRRVSWKTCWRI